MFGTKEVCICVTIIVALTLAAQAGGATSSADDTVKRLADRVRQNQILCEPEIGVWPNEAAFMGATTAGMACAYEWTKDTRYLESARLGAYYSVFTVDIQGNLPADVAYALVTLSQAYKRETPEVNDIWQRILVEFYQSLRDPLWEGSTEAYIDYFDFMEPSLAVLCIAYHLLGADYASDVDAHVWRDALVAHLSRVDDKSACPVMALGMATWALAKTGKLDETPVALSGGSGSCWEGVLLQDLPALLLSHQVPDGEPYGGSFYWRFDHAAGSEGGAAAGFTEDAVYGALGLVAAASLADPNDDKMEQAITAVNEAILKGVDAEGRVYEHLSRQGATYNLFAGEVLQALWSVKQHLADVQAETPSVETVPASLP